MADLRVVRAKAVEAASRGSTGLAKCGRRGFAEGVTFVTLVRSDPFLVKAALVATGIELSRWIRFGAVAASGFESTGAVSENRRPNVGSLASKTEG